MKRQVKDWILLEKDIPLIKTHDLIKLNGMINEVKD